MQDIPNTGKGGERPRDCEVLERCADAVRRYCRRHTATPEDAEDAAQDTFIRFLQRRPEPLENAEAWLMTVASRACADLHRRLARADSRPVVDGAGAAGDPADVLVGRLSLQDVLERLAPKDRQILASLYVAGMSGGQVARRLNVSPASLRVMALRARRRARGIAETMGHTVGGLSILRGLRDGWSRLRWGLRCRRHGFRDHPAVGQLENGPLGYWGITCGAVPLAAMALLNPGGQLGAASLGSRADLPAYVQLGDDATGHVSAPLGRPPGSGLIPPRAAGPVTGPAEPFGGPQNRGSGEAVPGGGSSVGAGTDGGARSQASVGGAVGRAGTAVDEVVPAQPVDPANAQFSFLTPAPDGSTLASGARIPCLSSCSVLFSSPDEGRRWRQLQALGFAGGRMIVPPHYPADPTLFAAGPLGLQRSDDGGGSFRPVVPGEAAASVDPASAPGDARVVVASLPLTVYSERTGLLTPGPLLPPGMRTVQDVSFNSLGQLLVTGGRLPAMVGGPGDSVVAVCAGAACSVTASLPTSAPLHLAPSAPAAAHHVLVFGADRLYSSDDDGARFRGGRVAGLSVIVAATPPPAGARAQEITLVATPMRARSTVLLRSGDGGSSFSIIPSRGLPAQPLVRDLLRLPGGTFLTALALPDASAGFGIRFSTDGALTWKG